MLANVELTPDLRSALQAEVKRTGRSEQDILSEAIAQHLRPGGGKPLSEDRWAAQDVHLVRPARVAYRKVMPQLRLPSTNSLDLLDRL